MVIVLLPRRPRIADSTTISGVSRELPTIVFLSDSPTFAALNYANRFYNRQFIPRKNASHELLIKLETVLSDYINDGKLKENGLPTVKYLSDQMNMSANYLGDMLKKLTGQSTQHHIHNRLFEKAKAILTFSSLSVSEIAYDLGFEYPQSFSKLFKQKTDQSPLEFRNSFRVMKEGIFLN